MTLARRTSGQVTRRRDLLSFVAAAVAALPWSSYAQPATIPRIGLLDPGIAHLFRAFIKGMADLGYVDGQTVSYVLKSTNGGTEGFDALAGELVRLKVSVIVTAGVAPVRAAMNATSTIPIVFAANGDAIGYGFVKSLAQPGGNVTGLSFLNTEISAKRLEILHDAFPAARRAAVLADKNIKAQPAIRVTEEAARRLGIEALVIGVASPDEFDGAFRAARESGAEIMDVLASPFFNAHRHRLAEVAVKYRLPAMYETSEYPPAGCLMSYGPNLAELFRRAAIYVDKILKGANPADLPVEQATRFELVVNLKVANEIGASIASSVLVRADEVIE